ncbi:unnamed protein product [Phyllotreta striolata]|uniref:CCC domain-containing protein n=1 Tax=Phyllotreta striolata TaxID=444603 RepID=A0A9N9TS58_PHYSR|nr:unnamed protein product [Phyllotreta striolata]
MVIVKALVIYLLIKCGAPSPAIEKDAPLKYEEYIVEHEISSMSARNSVLTMDISSINTPSGCKECNPEEQRYCLGTDLINDHCCCDKRYHELFPYIPHTCYLGPQLCHTIATDCTEYHRILSCCCQKLTAEKFREFLLRTTEIPETTATTSILVTSELITELSTIEEINTSQQFKRFAIANTKDISIGKAKSGSPELPNKVFTHICLLIFIQYTFL